MEKITRDKFLSCVGTEPIQDDLERCNCDQAGNSGHHQCGWDHKRDMPNFIPGQSKANSRKIVIETCEGCPHRDHKGAFAQVSYVPKCGRTGKELPYTVVTPKCAPTMVTAAGTGVIPDWCPLDRN